MRKFLHGLFTTHLVTKVVSLLLASVLFVFTQQSISDEQTIDELTIRFELAPDLAKLWVLNKPSVVLKQMKVSGLRRDLAVQTGALRRADFIITKVITAQFLRNYYDFDNPGPILIDADLLRAEELPWDLGDEFQLELKRPEKLDLEKLREVTFRPVLTDAMKERLTLPESSPFRAADGGLVVTPEWVQGNAAEIGTIAISGPSSQLPVMPADVSEMPLYINVPNLAAYLREKTLAEAREPIGVNTIAWQDSGLGDPARLYVRAPLSESLDSLEKQTLHFRCDLKLTPAHVQVTLPFAFSTPAQGDLTLASVAKDYRYFGRNKRSPFDIQPPGALTEWTKVVNLDLEVTETWKGKEAELAQLFFLELDIANATKASKGRLEVPIRLKPRTVEAERILAENEVHLPDPLVIFQS